MESQAPAFDNEDLLFLDLDPPPQDAEADLSETPVAALRLGESSHNPITNLDVAHSSNEDEEDDQDDNSNND